MANKSYDVIIVGGGIIGSSIAYHLMCSDPRLKLLVVERDPAYERASTPLSFGGVRIQFSLQENILMSLYGQAFYSRFEEEMAVEDERPAIFYRRNGYLLLVDPEEEEAARADAALQNQLGGQVHWWTPEQIESAYPLMKLKDLAGGTFCAQDGYLDPYGALMGFRKKAISLGARYLQAEAITLLRGERAVSGVRLADGERLAAGVVVNAAGAWAGEIAKTAGVELPVTPYSRQAFAFKPAVLCEKPWPLVFTPDKLYFRSETGDLVLMSKPVNEEDPQAFEFSWRRERFLDLLWPQIARLVPAYETAKLVRGWAGLIDYNRMDGNAILGGWPHLEGFYLANGFTGRGIMHAPAAGRILSEYILGIQPFLELGALSPERVITGRPLVERTATPQPARARGGPQRPV